MQSNTAELADRLRKPFSGPMTEEEIEFLRDVQGAIDFAIRNGLSLAMITSLLFQDLNEITREGYDLKKAKARAFVPKVTGYRNLMPGDLGETDAVPE